MPGPKPKYTPEERARQGNPGRRPGDVKEPGVEYADFFPPAPVEAPPPPVFLANKPKALEIWDYLAAYIHESRLLRDGDLAALGRLCRYLAEWDELAEIIDDEGVVTNGSQGLQRHPAFIARNQLEAQIQKLESQFGLNPEDRLKLTKDAANSLRNLPLAGRAGKREDDKTGPVGFLKGSKRSGE